ncbi:MAG: biopolymer transporter ExbD [Planctomycetes bacterium]|nr:biopolymer transporter ExbD [Planctomycetota bacterium]
MTLRRRHGFHSTFINLTPLIDMSLMLVVFFVLCLTTSNAAMRSMQVTLPQAGNADAARRESLEITIDRSGAITVEKRSATIADLPRLAAKATSVSLLADKECRHGTVVEVVDALRRCGVTDIYYATAAPPEDL